MRPIVGRPVALTPAIFGLRQRRVVAWPAGSAAAMRTGRARTDGLITHRFKLDDIAGALDALRRYRTVHKIILEC